MASLSLNHRQLKTLSVCLSLSLRPQIHLSYRFAFVYYWRLPYGSRSLSLLLPISAVNNHINMYMYITTCLAHASPAVYRTIHMSLHPSVDRYYNIIIIVTFSLCVRTKKQKTRSHVLCIWKMKASHSLTGQFSCCCYLWVVMFSAARDFSPIEHNVCVTYFVIFVYISFNVCSFMYVVTTNLLLSFIFPFTPSPFVNYCYVTPSNQAPPHPPHPLALCVSWSLTCCTWLRNYIIVFFMWYFCTVCLVFNYIVYVCA